MHNNLLATARVDWRSVGIFTVIAYVGAWVAVSPLVFSGYQRTSNELGQTALTQVCVAAMMLVPALVALGMLRWRHRQPNIRVAIGLTRPRPAGRFVRASLLALAVPIGLQLAALGISAAAGKYAFDLSSFSGFRAEFAPDTVGQSGAPVAEILAFLGTVVLGMILWLPMFFGEELGWQGYLLPRLAKLGTLPALLLTSVVVALWHLPTLFLGGQYPGHSLPESIAYMLIGTTLLVPIFCWLRMRFDSVWPVVLAHTVVSSVNIRLVWLFADADTVTADSLDPFHVGLNGWPGWLVMGAFVAVLAATGQFRWQHRPTPTAPAMQ